MSKPRAKSHKARGKSAGFKAGKELPAEAARPDAVGSRITLALSLVRPANVLTAGADSMAGFLIAGGDLQLHGWVVVRLIFASMALYAGGVALNDVADAPADAISRPDRPISAGILSRTTAGVIGVLLLALGLGAAISVGTLPAMVAGMCILAILLYDLVLRRTPLAPIVMGACRASNMALGISAVGGLVTGVTMPVVILFVYVSSLTLFARRETGSIKRDPLIAGSIGMIGAAAATIFLIPWSPAYGLGWLSLVGMAAAWVARLGWQTIHAARPKSVQTAVKWLVLGIVGLDALMVGATCGLGTGLMVLVFLIPGALLARRFSVA